MAMNIRTGIQRLSYRSQRLYPLSRHFNSSCVLYNPVRSACSPVLSAHRRKPTDIQHLTYRFSPNYSLSRHLNSSCALYNPVRSRYSPNSSTYKRKSASRNNGQWTFDSSNGYDNPATNFPQSHIPSGGLIGQSDAVYDILSQPLLIIERKLELMNVMLGFEQANRYALMDSNGQPLGFMEEEDFGLGKAIMRQVYRLHRPFTVRLYNLQGTHVLTIRRPFSFINSHIKAILPSSHEENSIIVGESRQSWHLWRRRYNLFMSSGQSEFDQFAKVDSPFLAFSFPMYDSQGKIMGAVDRNWVGLGREMFTDTGVYMLRMDPTALADIEPEENLSTNSLTLDERAVALATAVSIDFDYFSRHSGRGGLVSFGDPE